VNPHAGVALSISRSGSFMVYNQFHFSQCAVALAAAAWFGSWSGWLLRWCRLDAESSYH
jgi:hypothetical protein